MEEEILRLLASVGFGCIIGIDREFRAKEAGLRTHILVCLGSALMMVVSQFGFKDITDFDPSRIAAQVVSGIGFLGAGTIIIQKHFVRGLTTAAGMWATAGIGLAAGAGMYAIAGCATLLTLVGLELTNLLNGKISLHSTLLIYTTSNHDAIRTISSDATMRNCLITSITTEEVHDDTNQRFRVTMIFRSRGFEQQTRFFRFIQEQQDVIIERWE